MKVKRIFAPDMRQAMKRVRDEIGPQAIIVSNHRIAGGVEVVAAHEDDFESAQSQFKHQQSVRGRREQQVDLLTTGSRKTLGAEFIEQEKKVAQSAVLKAKGRSVSEYVQQERSASPELARNQQLESGYDEDLESILASLKKKKKGASDIAANEVLVSSEHTKVDAFESGDAFGNTRDIDPEDLQQVRQKNGMHDGLSQNDLIEDMQQEITQLKKMLAGQMPGAYKAETGTVSNALVVDKLEQRFEQIGLGRIYAKQIKAKIDPGLDLSKAWRKSLASLVDVVPVVNYDFIERGGMIAFVGPTGVGKTTTIGKLAAKYVLENGSSGVALVTTDSYRIAAHEQLKTFGRILDVPVRVVDEKNSLAEVLESLKNKRLVLIDTAGLGSSDAASQRQGFMLENVSVNLKKLLVLSCSAQRQVLDDAYDSYSPLGLSGCVLTKVDESGSMGAALTLAIERKLAIAYVSSGQKVPDDIHVAHKNDLVSRAVLTAQKSREREKIRHNASM